jgi:two-component system sensor histidine kinase UhpB
MSLRFRLNLMIGLTLLAIVGAGGLLALHDARRSVQDDVGASLRLALQLVEAEWRAAETAPAAGHGPAHWQQLEAARRWCIQVEQGGQSWQWQPAEPPRSEAVPQWFRRAVAPQFLRGETHWLAADGSPVQVWVEADPGAETAEAWREAHGFFLLMTVLAAAVLLLVYVTLGRAFAAVNRILAGLQHMESGNYAERLPVFPVQEFTRISEAFNHAAESLGKARADNRALTRRLLQVQEDERRALVRELHDELGQSLSAMKALAVSLRQFSSNGAQRDIAVSLVGLCDHLFPVVRGMMQRMRPLMLEELGLAAALEDLLDGWRSRCPQIRWQLACDAAVDELPESLQIQVFRIVQEALSNAVKHAAPSQVRAGLAFSDDGLCLSVADDGAGFDPQATTLGMGLTGMRERVLGLDGEFRIVSSAGQGTRIEARIPFPLKSPPVIQ